MRRISSRWQAAVVQSVHLCRPVVDTMEALMDADSGGYKRLHSTVDSGFIYVSGTYTGESVQRRRDSSGALIDTDDSGADFEVLSMPDPNITSDL